MPGNWVQEEITGVVPPRVVRAAAGDPAWIRLLTRLVDLSVRGLPAMRAAENHQFAFTRRIQRDGQLAVAGHSLRYAAIVLLGATHLDRARQRVVFGGQELGAFADGVVDGVAQSSNLGDIALVAWAATLLGHPRLGTALDRLTRLLTHGLAGYTVELAWALSALSTAAQHRDSGGLVTEVRDRLLRCCSSGSGLFGHWTEPLAAPWYRSHVGCFADQVYPIQALSLYHKAVGHQPSLEAAARCAETICRLQGDDGQWWWHYDVRTGEVVEGYPVYTVHQDSMAPMALMDLAEAGGPNHGEAIRRGLTWMEQSSEVGRCLIDDEHSLIWRSVKRGDPAKVVRKVRAVVSRLAPGCRLNWLSRCFRPVCIDYEDRPYHLGWILHAWLGQL